MVKKNKYKIEEDRNGGFIIYEEVLKSRLTFRGLRTEHIFEEMDINYFFDGEIITNLFDSKEDAKKYLKRIIKHKTRKLYTETFEM